MTRSLKGNALLAALQVNQNSKDRGYQIKLGVEDLILEPWHLISGRGKTISSSIRVSDSGIFCRDEDLVNELKEAIDRVDENLVPKVEEVGNPNCKHRYIFYEDGGMFSFQIWKCDEPGCGRRESLAYSPGLKIKFPSNAYIRTPNLEFGGEVFYSYKSNADGVVTEVLSPEKRLYREKLKLEARVQ